MGGSGSGVHRSQSVEDSENHSEINLVCLTTGRVRHPNSKERRRNSHGHRDDHMSEPLKPTT